MQRWRCSVRGPIAVPPPPAALEGYARFQLLRVRGVPELYYPTQGRHERRWTGVDVAMQRIWALHSRALPRRISHAQGTDDSLRTHVYGV